jgi:signal transduction histidine kinase
LLFKPYGEIKANAFAKNNATGMGLTCSHTILENIGGKTYLKQSEKGLTVFVMNFPIIIKES